MDILQYLEDFDNAELNDYDWEEQMREAVDNFNAEFNAAFDKAKTIARYKRWKYNLKHAEPTK